jgi:hypothetical protein
MVYLYVLIIHNNYWLYMHMQKTKQQQEKLQKITIFVPRQILADAQEAARSNITETVKNGLLLLIAANAAQNLRKMRGKAKFTIDINALREDR